ncbi:MAG TPA: class I SAM-dependent methyltransferase [Pseudolabrys sp.]|nr:class I SAM-dependent methyltransferase [Pseudolabrys sp.]
MDAASEKNLDPGVARAFGEEWSAFRQGEASLSPAERRAIFGDYFRIFPWHLLPQDGGIGADIGCGSGRWAMLVAPRTRHLHVLDPSPEALAVARENLKTEKNVTFHLAGVGDIPLPSRALDFAFSLGVLHHVPDTQAAIDAIAAKLKPGAPFLLYLYYAFDNRPRWYAPLWALTNVLRLLTSRLPHRLRIVVSETIAAAVYWPLARLAGLLSRAGIPRGSLPLSWYADKSFYVMRTDAYDRFCTRIEKRFTRAEIERMLAAAGFGQIRFSELPPYWCAVGIRSADDERPAL